jgi:hypothetical protein
VCAFRKAIKTDHPDLQDSWLEATMHLSPEHVLPIPVRNYCIMKEKEVKHPMTSLLPSVDPFLAGATHYYQYDLAISSTPRKCVDVFALGAAGSNALVTHMVGVIIFQLSFPILPPFALWL